MFEKRKHTRNDEIILETKLYTTMITFSTYQEANEFVCKVDKF